jgi:DNA polymerase IV
LDSNKLSCKLVARVTKHDQHGRGWVWGSSLGRVTVRFEIKDTPPGPVWTFASDDPALDRLWT